MNQAGMQFMFDLQRFAEDVPSAEAEPETAEAEGAEDVPAATSEDSKAEESASEAPDYAALGDMSQSEQVAFLRRHGLTGETKEADVPEAEEAPEDDEAAATDEADSSEQEEPAYEVTVDGEKQRVKLSELLSGYQRQADYTRKTQALAEERRQVDAMLAALKVEKQKDAGRAADDKAKSGGIQQEYEAAVREAEKMLGIGAGEFNSFDPQHAFALQKVMMEGASRRTAAQEVQSIVQAFAAEAQKDPMSSAIDAHFNQYLFERGAASPEGGKQAARIAEAQGRFMRGQATRADCDVLKEHWEYVRGKLKAQTVPKKEEKVVQDAPVPPKTETPGTGRGAERRAALDVHKLGRMTAGQQLAALKRAGVLSMPK